MKFLTAISILVGFSNATIIRCDEMYSNKKEIAVKCFVRIIGDATMGHDDYPKKAAEEARGAAASYVMPDVCYQTVNIKTSDHMISAITQTLSVSYSRVYPVQLPDRQEAWGIGYGYESWFAFKAMKSDIDAARTQGMAKCESSGRILSEYASKNMKYDKYSNKQTLKGFFAFASLVTFSVAGMMYLSDSDTDTPEDRNRQLNALKWSSLASGVSLISLCF